MLSFLLNAVWQTWRSDWFLFFWLVDFWSSVRVTVCLMVISLINELFVLFVLFHKWTLQVFYTVVVVSVLPLWPFLDCKRTTADPATCWCFSASLKSVLTTVAITNTQTVVALHPAAHITTNHNKHRQTAQLFMSVRRLNLHWSAFIYENHHIKHVTYVVIRLCHLLRKI